MATNAKRENPEHLENSELEVLRTKIRKLEQENFELKATVSANPEELQIISNDQVGHHETQETDVIDFLSAFMNNPGFKPIADNLLSLLDHKSFHRCRLVCRSWKNYIDNEWSMLQLQIFHLKWHGTFSINGQPYWEKWPYFKDGFLIFKPLFKVMEKTTNKSELRIFIQMCRELVSEDCSYKLENNPIESMIDHHRHQELTMLLHCEMPKYICDGSADFTRSFKYACQEGCVKCVKLFLDRSEEKGIDLNLISEWETPYLIPHEYMYEHCLHVANRNLRRKEVLDLLLRSAEEKGINIHAKKNDVEYYGDGKTLKENIINNFAIGYSISKEDYTEETYKILKIDPSVDLKFESESESESGSETP